MLPRCAAISSQPDASALHQVATELAKDELPEGWAWISRAAHARVAVNRDQQLYLKHYLMRNPAEILRARVRGSRAERARLNSEALLLAGVDAPRPVHWGSLPGAGEYLFTEALPGDNIAHWLCETLRGSDTERLRLRRQLLDALGTFIGRLHATGFVHGGLRPGNVVASLQGGQFHFALINNENNVRRSPTPGRMLLRNLTQLNLLSRSELGRADRMRFFRAWRRQIRSLSPVEAKILAGESCHNATRRLQRRGTGPRD